MAPTYILAVDHLHREVVLAVRGTKAFGDAITITHFRPEPFLDGCVTIRLHESVSQYVYTRLVYRLYSRKAP